MLRFAAQGAHTGASWDDHHWMSIGLSPCSSWRGSGSCARFTADRVLDALEIHCVVLRECEDGLSRAMALGNDGCCDSGAGNDGLSKAASRVDDDGLGLREVYPAHPRVKSGGDLSLPLDSIETCVEHLPEHGLPAATRLEKAIGMFDKQGHSVSAETARRVWPAAEE